MSADEDLGYAYLPTGSPTSDMYGGHRLGNNLFGNSLVCVKCMTGALALATCSLPFAFHCAPMLVLSLMPALLRAGGFR